MSFLPFVLSFLLILVLGSSFLFTSFRSLSLERTIILAQKKAQISLLSEQGVQAYKQSKKKKPENTSPPAAKKKDSSSKPYVEERSLRQNLDTSKFNLWPMIEAKDPSLSKALYHSAIRLLQILYEEADFYKAAKDPGLAKKIIDMMIELKGETLLELYPKKEPLASIYHKMLKGTNTGYPSLEEYFKIDKATPAIRFAYASTPVLQAILGKDTTDCLLAAEKASWEVNHREKILSKEKFKELLQHHPSSFDINLMEIVFSYERKGKGLPHSHIEAKSKVMATTHSSERVSGS